jgi:hypothetical protein
MMREGEKKMKALERFLVLLVLVAVFAGCTDNRQSFFVRDIKIPSEEDCVVQSDRNTPFRPYGRMDLAFGGSFFIHPLVENAMTTSERLSPVTAESNRISVTGAEVSLEFEDGTPITGEPFFVATSALVEPGGVVATSFEAIPVGYMVPADAGQVVYIRFRILGVTGGGKEVDTPRFTFPVLTCYGCLVQFPPEAYDTERGCYDCCDIGSGGDMQVPCNYGQDDWVDCRLCAEALPELCVDPDCPC